MRERTNQCWEYWAAIAIGFLILLNVLMAGCQMVHGAALDIESAARYTADHTVTDR